VVLLPLVLVGLLQVGQPRFERLDSGLRVVIVEDHALPLVSVQLWYRVGSAYDPPGKPGLCSVVRSVLEHRGDAALKLRAAGVRFESRTERDACYFSSVLPPNFLEYVLDIEAARMKPLTVSVEMVERGLNAAALEYADVADDPNHVLMRHVLAAMFPDHPYQHPPRFVAESLKELSPDEVNEFLRRWFVPGNATLFVIGDVSTVQVLEQVRQRFGTLERAEPPRRAEPKHLEPETIQITISHPSPTGITIAWRTPPLGYFENAAIDVLMHGLCDRVQKVLRAAFWDETQTRVPPLVSPCDHRLLSWRDAGVLILELTYSPRVHMRRPTGWTTLTYDHDRAVKEIMAAVDQELRRAADRPAGEIEHNQARASALRAAWDQEESFAARARRLASYELVGGDILLAGLAAAQARGVAVSDVQAAAVLLSQSRRVAADVAREGQSDPKPILLRAIQGTTPATMDLSRLFARLASYAADVPRVERPSKPPRVESCDVGNIACKTCAADLGGNDVVLTIRRIPGQPRMPLEPRLDYPGHVAQQLDQCRPPVMDYVRYHSIKLKPSYNWGAAALGCQLPADRLPAAIELLARLLTSTAAEGEILDGRYTNVEVVVVGDLDTGVLREQVAEVWGAWQPPDTQTADARDLGHVFEPRLYLRWAPSKSEHASLRLAIDLAPWRNEDRLGSLELATLAVLLGRVTYEGDMWDARTAPRWCPHFYHADNRSSLTATAETDERNYTEVIRAIWSRVAALRKGTLPPAQLETALHLARTERLVSLDNGWAIANALWQRREDPWDIHCELTPDRLSINLSNALREVPVWIQLFSREDFSEDIGALESELNLPGG